MIWPLFKKLLTLSVILKLVYLYTYCHKIPYNPLPYMRDIIYECSRTREGVIIERPLNGQFHDNNCDVILMSLLVVSNLAQTMAVSIQIFKRAYKLLSLPGKSLYRGKRMVYLVQSPISC